MDLENLPEVFPLNFFDAKIAIPQKKKNKFTSENLLPNFEDLNFSENFVEAYMAWDEQGLYFQFDIDSQFESSQYPDFLRKDAIELFIHTRADSLTRYMNKFSHHFLLFPVKINGIMGMEITKFRGEDRHELSLPESIQVTSEIKKKSYSLEVAFSKDILYGYDPSLCKEIRLDFRVHRFQNEPKFFFFNSSDISEHQLSLWPKIDLV